MPTITTPSSLALVPSLETAWQDVDSSFERFCLTAGIGAIEQMLCEDARQLAGAPHYRGAGRVGHRWGRTKGKIGFHGGKIAVHRPRVRSYDGHEVALLGLPVKLRRSLACTNSIENMMGTVRRVCRNVKRWRNAAMALRWTAAGMMEAAKGFRRLKAYKHLPVLRAALAAHQSKYVTQRVEHDADAA